MPAAQETAASRRSTTRWPAVPHQRPGPTLAAAVLASLGAGRDELPDSMALIERGRVHLRSTAALRIARRLDDATRAGFPVRGPWIRSCRDAGRAARRSAVGLGRGLGAQVGGPLLVTVDLDDVGGTVERPHARVDRH